MRLLDLDLAIIEDAYQAEYALFAALFFVKLAPWDWDNTKVMLWCYLLVLPGLEALVLARLGVLARAAVLIGPSLDQPRGTQ